MRVSVSDLPRLQDAVNDAGYRDRRVALLDYFLLGNATSTTFLGGVLPEVFETDMIRTLLDDKEFLSANFAANAHPTPRASRGVC